METGQSRPSRDPTLILFLGLFLILLAFFIMLNSLAVVDAEKTATAMDSVSSQFGESRQPNPIGLDPQAMSEAALSEGFHGQVETSFNAVLPVAEFLPLPHANALQVMVPANTLFAAGESTIQLRAAILLDRLSEALSGAGAGESFEVETFFELAAEASADARDLTRRRAATFARELVDRGVDPRRVTAGIEAGEEQKVRMFFIARQGDPQKITFAP